MISFLFKIFIWKMALSLGVLSFLPLSAFPLNNLVVQSSEQRGGDLRQEAETKNEASAGFESRENSAASAARMAMRHVCASGCKH